MDNALNLEPLTRVGLNQHAVFNISELPFTLQQQMAHSCQQLGLQVQDYSQVILVAHLGRSFWNALTRQIQEVEGVELGQLDSDSGLTAKPEAMSVVFSEVEPELQHPVDDYAIQMVRETMDSQPMKLEYQILYPLADSTQVSVNLQAFGECAGWHFSSPMSLGVNSQWGTWFAYRALILVDSQFEVTLPAVLGNPCNSCTDTPCISACPVEAVTLKGLDTEACVGYRVGDDSACQQQCLSRMSCPAGQLHQYSEQQINYHYLQSYQLIRRFRLT